MSRRKKKSGGQSGYVAVVKVQIGVALTRLVLHILSVPVGTETRVLVLVWKDEP